MFFDQDNSIRSKLFRCCFSLDPYSYQVLQTQRTLEQTFEKLFTFDSTTNVEENLQMLLKNLIEYIPLICALDLYYPLIRLLLSYSESHFDLSIYILCYVTSITDDRSEDFGVLNLNEENSSSTNSFQIYVWLKKFWLSRYVGHALFSSSLDSIDLLSQTNSTDKDEFLNEIRNFSSENVQMKFSSIEYLKKTIFLLGELPSLCLNETKEIVQLLINYLSQVSYGCLPHVLLWLIANYQIGTDEERLWIRENIENMGSTFDFFSFCQLKNFSFIRLGSTKDSTTTIYFLLDAVKGQLWSDFIDNPLSKCRTTLQINSSNSTLSQCTTALSQSATSLICQISENYVTNEFLDCEQCRSLFICSKFVPIHQIITRLLINLNTSNGIYETRRALFFIFGFVLFRRRLSTCYLLEEIFPLLINIKSNDFMLEPNVYHTCLVMNILLVLEFNSSDEQLGQRFRVKLWKEFSSSTNSFLNNFNIEIYPKYDDTTVIDAFDKFLTWASNELFSSDNVRPVNYFLGWLQTILWMFNRTAKVLKPFIKSKLVR